MWPVMDRRPRCEPGEILASKAKTWAATVSDSRLSLTEFQGPVGAIAIRLFGATADYESDKFDKVLIVADTKGTTVYVTFREAMEACKAKRALGAMFSRWGSHVEKSVLSTMRMFSHRDYLRIQKWYIAEEPSTGAASGATTELGRKLALFEKKRATTSGSSTDIPATRVSDTLATRSPDTLATLPVLEERVASLRVVPEQLRQEKSQLKRRLDQLDDEWEAGDRAVRLLVEDEGRPLQRRYEALESGEMEHDAEVALTAAVKALHFAQLDAEVEEGLAELLVYRVLDFKPDAPLFVQSFMSEAEREGMIHDRVDDKQQLQQRFLGARETGDRAKAVGAQTDIVKKVVGAGLQLVEEGRLPDFHGKNVSARPAFVARAANVTSVVTGEQFKDTKAILKMTKSTGECSACDGPLRHEPSFYLDTTRAVWKPMCMMQAEKTPKDALKMFCSKKCERKWNMQLVCPACGGTDYARSTELDWPDPKTGPQWYPSGGDEQSRQYALNKKIEVPMCVKCNDIMLPRDPWPHHMRVPSLQSLIHETDYWG